MSLFPPTRDKLHLTVSGIMLLGFKIRLGSCAGVDMVEVGNSRAFVMYRGSLPTQGSSLSKRMLRLGRRAQFFRALPSSRVHRSQHVEVWSARVLYFSPFDMKTCTCLGSRKRHQTYTARLGLPTTPVPSDLLRDPRSDSR